MILRTKVSNCIGVQPAPDGATSFEQHFIRMKEDQDVYVKYLTIVSDKVKRNVDDGYDSLSEMLDACVTNTITDKIKTKYDLRQISFDIARVSRRGVGKLITVKGKNYMAYAPQSSYFIRAYDAPFTLHYYNGKEKWNPHPDINKLCARLPRIRFITK